MCDRPRRKHVSSCSVTMTELLVSRGDTFPRTFLDNYRSHRSRASEQLYNELKASKSDELVLQSPTGIEVPSEIHHGHSDNVLDTNISPCASPTQADFLDKPEVMTLPTRRKVAYDRIDPEDSIRDMVTENDFYRLVKSQTQHLSNTQSSITYNLCVLGLCCLRNTMINTCIYHKSMKKCGISHTTWRRSIMKLRYR